MRASRRKERPWCSYDFQFDRVSLFSAGRVRCLLAAAPASEMAELVCRRGQLLLLRLVGLAVPVPDCIHLGLQFRSGTLDRPESVGRPDAAGALDFGGECRAEPWGALRLQVLQLLRAESVGCLYLSGSSAGLAAAQHCAAGGHQFLYVPGYWLFHRCVQRQDAGRT